MDSLEAYRALMATPRRVVITTHYNPDADALGSSLALAYYLQKKQHQVQVIVPSEYPSFLYWMNGKGEVLIYNSATHAQCEEYLRNAEVVCCLDFSIYSRLQTLEALVRQSPAKILVIDHHQNPEINPDFWLWDDKASSTSQLVYDLIEEENDQDLIDVRIGELIYAGIVTDTSSFKHSSTTPRALIITAQLMQMGVDTNRVQRLIYDSYSEERMHFIGFALQNRLRVLHEYHTAYFALSADDLAKFHAQMGDTEGLVNFALAIKDISLAATIIERPDGVKISFRSTGHFPVNEFAQQHFGGGGHRNAAACMTQCSLAEIEQKFLDLLPQYAQQLALID